MAETVTINRAPVLTLWGAVVSERLGYDYDAALTMGNCLAGLNAQSKGRMLGIYGPPKKVGLGEHFWIELCGRGLPCQATDDGIRAVVKDKSIDPIAVEKYLDGKFGDDLERVRDAMVELAAGMAPDELADKAYGFYEQFRPNIPAGRKGWGAKGDLDLDLIRSLGGIGVSIVRLWNSGSP